MALCTDMHTWTHTGVGIALYPRLPVLLALSVNPPSPQVVHELIERFDAHLKAEQFYSVVANMRGNSPEDVAQRLLTATTLQGLDVSGDLGGKGEQTGLHVRGAHVGMGG